MHKIDKSPHNEVISIVIPVYNSNQSLKIIAEGIDLMANDEGIDYELIFVNDSQDNPETWKILKELSQQIKQVKAINLTRNFGQQAATMCGIKVAQGDFIITMDDDLQHNPNDIPKFLEKRHKHDILIGQFSSKKHNYFKRFTSYVKEFFDRKILNKPKGVQLSSFRLFSRIVADGILRFNPIFPYIPAMLLHVSKDISGVHVSHQPRVYGKSGYSVTSLIILFSSLIINNSSILLKTLAYIGGISLMISLLLGIFSVSQFSFHDTSLIIISLILFFGGLLLIATGIIGNYLIKIISYAEQKSSYHIREIIE